MSSVIFSDFDGVLFDSVKEAYLLSRYAYDSIDAAEPIDQNEFNLFRNFRYLITHSIHFYYIWKLLKEKTNENIFEDKYYKLLSDKSLNRQAEIFDEKYVNYRINLIENNYEFWSNLDKPYDFFFDFLNLANTNSAKFVIVTNKKRKPVEDKLVKFNAQNITLIANEDLKKFRNKSELIENYISENQITKAIFIEDNRHNLDLCKRIKNLTPVLADWGYIAPHQKGKTKQEVIKIIEEML